ncbi:dienelactone hydrolase family protein [Actinomadura barringtoniae]|uniref:Dienelactone hydrolase family protein n=1 Tax=Actinomadura barringtoniae TaxID=1427535 RepID=A0A939P651_9ACTN|nr:dienelactone hydrolase family protein [Actinomadura barringtoniae]MBO2446142.1 dienelactone hydrolase family protein [Actinomadura barringtoniae]
MIDDELRDFERATFTHDGKTRTIYRQGVGPAVIVMAEIPGISPKVADFARMVAGIGCTAVMPHLFGAQPGRDPNPSAHGMAAAGAYAAQTMIPLCVSREFTVMATGKSSPVIDWLRALAATEHERCGGPGVGAVGMCFTGGFALAMAADDRLLAPVLSQPSLPLGLTRKQRAAIDISPDELATVKKRCAEGLEVLGLRFTGDRLVPKERFATLRRELGDAFIAIELDDADANPDAALKPHSVLTEHLIDEPGQPTRDAVDQVLAHFRRRLLNRV